MHLLRNISMSKPLIHILSSQVSNQIAAGEVVERPASVVKELVENALDAGATALAVRIISAGKKSIVVEDNGCGMSPVDAELSLQRHATSKIETSDDLHHIASHGFRGEALPSIASVSRFRMQTAAAGSREGVEVRVDGGGATEVRPSAFRQGTRIEVLDLFLNTPARLNFMRTDKTEEAAVVEAFRVLALANPAVAMKLELDGRSRFDFAAQNESARTMAVMGRDFADNSAEIVVAHEGMQISGHLGLPTFHYRDATRILFMINGRVVRDKQLIAAVRAGYRDVMFHDRYPVAVIKIEIDPADVDVNVHPAKREVRFKSPQAVRAGVVACIRAAIEQFGRSVSSTTTDRALHSMRQGAMSGPSSSSFGRASAVSPPKEFQHMLFSHAKVSEPEAEYRAGQPDLGHPLAQIHRCYILAQTESGIILVDQHAAHERMTYEKIKAQLAGKRVSSQKLLAPAALRLHGKAAAWLHDSIGALTPFGVELEAGGEELFTIHAVPAMLVKESAVELVSELVESCMLMGADAEGEGRGLGRVLERWLGNRACKASIKSGHALSHEEQEALLREMEKTPNIAQCNHGRPTYVTLSLNDLDRLFGRRE